MEIRSILQKHNLYATKSRCTVIETLLANPIPQTVKELHSLVKENGADLATVHRTLNAFVKHGIVTAISTGKGRKYVLNCLNSHAHIVICLGCGENTPFSNPLSEDSIKLESENARKEFGFRIVGHSVVHYGYCEKCQKSTNVDICNNC